MMTITGQQDQTTTDAGDRTKLRVSAGLSFFTRDSDLIGTVEELRRTKYLPEEIITLYMREALKQTVTTTLDDGAVFAEIPGFIGLWASDEDLDACIVQLREALFDWLVLKIEKEDRDIPVLVSVPNINLNVV